MKDLNHYLQLPYTVVLRRDEDGDFVARVDELPGCSAHGKTPQEAVANVEEAQRLWVEDALEAGDPVPEPTFSELLPSGKWVQRVPRTLHRKLVQIARAEKVSLNQLVTYLLSEAVGKKHLPGLESQISAGSAIEVRRRSLLEGLWYGRHADIMPDGVVLLYDDVTSEPHKYCSWSIHHSPEPSVAVNAAARIVLEQMKKALPDHLQTTLKVPERAIKTEKAHRTG